MKKIFLLFCFIFLCIPVFAWNEKAAEESLQYLNNLVYPKMTKFKKILESDYTKIKKYNSISKQNVNHINSKKIYNFGLACKKRHQKLLNIYENEYFKPAYKKYSELDNSMSFEDWKYSVALSEMSLFYEFYRSTEVNLEYCDKLKHLNTRGLKN